MLTESHLSPRENQSLAESQADPTVKPQSAPNEENAKPPDTAGDKNGAPLPIPDEAYAVAEGRSPQSDG